MKPYYIHIIHLMIILSLAAIVTLTGVSTIGYRHDQMPTQAQYAKVPLNQADSSQIRPTHQDTSSVRANVNQRLSPYRLHPDRFRVGTNGCLIRVFLQRKISPSKNHFNAPKIDYFGVVGIGQPVGFLFNVVFDTRSRESWFPHRGIYFDELHYNSGYMCHSQSQDCSYITKYEFTYAQSTTTRFRGWIYRDNFTLYEDIQKDDVNHLITKEFVFPNIFLAVKEASNDQFKHKPYDGIIGLSPVVSQGPTGLNFLLALQGAHHNLVRTNNSASSTLSQLNPLMFGLWLNPNQQSHHGGEITFGGYDSTKVSSEFRYHKLTSYTDWQVRLETVRLGSVMVSCDSGCNMLLDTGTNTLYGPEQDVIKIHSILGSYREPASGLYIVDCSTIENLPKLQYIIEYTPYELESAHYVKVFRYGDLIICHADIKPWKESNWRVGTAFIGAYYSVFDMAERRIGFATSSPYS